MIPPLEIWHARHRHGSIPSPIETAHALTAVPEGAIESGVTARTAHIGGRAALRIELVTVSIDGDRTLTVRPLAPARTGDIGLFVDIGTEAFFRNLHIVAD